MNSLEFVFSNIRLTVSEDLLPLSVQESPILFVLPSPLCCLCFVSFVFHSFFDVRMARSRQSPLAPSRERVAMREMLHAQHPQQAREEPDCALAELMRGRPAQRKAQPKFLRSLGSS